MNLDDLDTQELSEKGVPMELLDPSGNAVVLKADQTPVTISLLGQDSEEYLRVQREQIAKRVAQTQGHRRKLYTQEQQLEDALDLLSAITTGWDGIENSSGPIPFNRKNVKEVYRRYPWIREQADRFVTNRVNFMKGLSGTSENTPGTGSSSSGQSQVPPTA